MKQKRKDISNYVFYEAVSIPPKSRLLYPLSFSIKWLILNKFPSVAEKVYKVLTTPRIAELPFVHQNLRLKESCKHILEVGCTESRLAMELASLGYEVCGIDIRKYPFKHPNFNFILGDICNAPFQSDSFDAVVSVSTIEHIGLGLYGDPVLPEGDKKALKEWLEF
jgi:SAM-dependent methyltransferase